jgi:hypothetical protein
MGDTTRLPVTRFSTAQHLGPDRWDAWRDSISVLFGVSPLIAATAPDDEHSVLGAHLGAVLFGETRFAAQSFERSQRKLIGNKLDHYLVQFYAKGGYAGRTGDEDVVLRPGDVCILDLAQTLRRPSVPPWPQPCRKSRLCNCLSGMAGPGRAKSHRICRANRPRCAGVRVSIARVVIPVISGAYVRLGAKLDWRHLCKNEKPADRGAPDRGDHGGHHGVAMRRWRRRDSRGERRTGRSG